MLYNENLREEEQHLIQQIAEQTERGKIDWELTEYNPLSFLNEDKIDKNPAVICQSFSFEAIIGGSRYELDVMENIDKDTILNHFPNIYQRCLEEGYDVTKECIPVVPAQHYFMGGIWVDSNSKTSMDQLYAVGETSCNGVHGANRLASNSLLESLVFAKRAAKAISAEKKSAAGAA